MRFLSPPEGPPVQRSLSILLPVRNKQATLAGTVQSTLEVLSDLPDDFELIIIDDGSSDATIEVADELASHYPQVVALRHATPKGPDAAVHTGLARSTGRIVLLKDGDSLRRIDRQPMEPLRRPVIFGADRADPPRRSSGTAKRPKYMSKLRDFALGE